MNKLAIIAHYNERLDWINRTDVPCIVYSKTDKAYNFIDHNKGQEIPCYLKYIIDNYNNLADKCVFVHGHAFSWHQDFNTDYILNNLNWNLSDYFSINRRDWYQEISDSVHIDKNGYVWIVENWNLFETFLNLPKQLKFYSGGQFCVDKCLILNYPLSFYKELDDWCRFSDLSPYIISRIFEYTWHYIFTKNPIEKKFEYVLL
jgi:hypothetical protein